MNIRRKLYPAVSMNTTDKVWEISAVFPVKDGIFTNFMFQGDHGNGALTPIVREDESPANNSDSAITWTRYKGMFRTVFMNYKRYRPKRNSYSLRSHEI